MPKKPKFSVVVPVYNSQETLVELTDKIHKTLNKMSENYEIIFIDDASCDNSWQILEEIYKKSSSNVKIIQLAKNFGQQNAVICGFQHSRGEYIITMDDDLQHPPENIPNLYNKLIGNNYDVVIAKFPQKKHSRFRNMGSNFLNYVNYKVFDKPFELKMTSFRIIKRSVIENILNISMIHPAIGPLILLTTKNISNVEVAHSPRIIGNSGYSLRKSLKLAFDAIVNYSPLPLKIISIIGLTSSTVGFCLAIYFIFHRIYIDRLLPGWTSLIVINLFFFGLILFSLGIIGEYLIRIVQHIKSYPTYIIRRKKL